MTTTGPGTTPGPIQRPRTSWDALRKRLEDTERNIRLLQKNRTPAPLKLKQLSDAGGMYQVPNGHAPTFSRQAGTYQPAPNYAEFIFHLQGTLVNTASPPYHSRWRSQIVGVSADMGTFASDITFEVLLNGTPIVTYGMTSESTGPIDVGPFEVQAYTDLVTVQVTDVGSGNSDLVVHVEYGSVVGGSPQLASG
jgi:hypothetical protein